MKIGTLVDVRARRVGAGIVSGMAGRFAALFAPLFATPAMLHYFGDATFGLWATSVSITSIAVIADLGIGNGLLTRIAAAHGKSDYLEIRKYLASAYAAIGAVAAVLLALTLTYFAVTAGSDVVLGVFAMFIIGMPGAVFYQFLYGIQKVPTSNLFLILGAVASVVSCLLAVHLAAPFWVVVVAYGLPPTLVSLSGAVWFFYKHVEFRPSIGAIEWHFAKDLLRLGSRFFLLSILTAVGLNIDNVIISTHVSPQAVAGYAITMRLGSLLGLVITALYLPLWAANGEALAKHDYQWIRRGAFRMSLFGFLLVAVSGGALVMFSDTIMMLWVGRTFANQHLILISVVASSAIVAATSPYNMVLNAMGRASIQILPWLAFVLISVALKFAIISDDHIWMMAAITGAVYALTVAPSMFLAARWFLSKAEQSHMARDRLLGAVRNRRKALLDRMSSGRRERP